MYNKQIGIWLLIGCVMIYLMVLIGGITRLTGSGLSIVEWKVISGIIPPMSEEGWRETFEKYQQFPQYQKLNSSMDLAAFKTIYWWEYIHRLWGRLIGLVFFIPFVVFLIQRKLNKSLIKKLLFAMLLGGLQAALGWIMVKSGLVDKPWVSPYRLSAHLLLALFLHCYLLWLSLELLISKRGMAPDKPLFQLSKWITALLGIQIFFGGLMSGLKAGLFYPTFPTMNGQWIPDELWSITVQANIVEALFENVATVQFIHRFIAYALTILIIIFWFKVKKSSLPSMVKKASHLLLAILVIQFLLGVFTIINSIGNIPLTLALLHQAGAVLLLTGAVGVNYLLALK